MHGGARIQQKRNQNRKTYLENIKVYEGTDKQKCHPWVNRLQQAAKCSNTSLRAALLARAGATVFGIVAATLENIDDLDMKKVVLRNFSDIATPMEAAQKLRNMRMTSDQPIASYNYNYAAVHEAAFNIHPSEQRMRFALEDYANSLPEYTTDKLSYKIVKVDSWIKTLQDAMDHAVKTDQESRQSEVMRTRRNDRSEVIDTTVNEISHIDINYVASRQGDSRFNSTMKPRYRTTPSVTTVAGTALEMTTQTSGRLTNINTMPGNLGTTSSLSTALAEAKRKS